MSEIQIRPYKPADLHPIIALFNGSVRQVASRDYSPAQIDAWAPAAVDIAAWSERLGRKPTFVAELAGELAGFSDLEPNGHIDMMFVHKDHQSLGVAQTLMEHIIRKALEARLSSLTTDASITARPFFERNRFTVLDAQDVELRGQIFRNYRMSRAL